VFTLPTHEDGDVYGPVGGAGSTRSASPIRPHRQIRGVAAAVASALGALVLAVLQSALRLSPHVFEFCTQQSHKLPESRRFHDQVMSGGFHSTKSRSRSEASQTPACKNTKWSWLLRQ
jgi:hypothetical protein